MELMEMLVLQACDEVVSKQQELLLCLSGELNLRTEQVFFEWAFRRLKQSGSFLNGDWKYFFHGLECDIKHSSDGRFLRIDFGPEGATNTFTAWGVLQFIMTTKTPWSNFFELKTFFAKNSPPYTQFSGSMEKMSLVWDKLESNGFIEKADQNLLDFAKRYTIINSNGMQEVQFPKSTPNKTIINCSVAGRNKISILGQKMLLGVH